MIAKCDTCQEYQPSNTMVREHIPTKPWEIMTKILFSCNSCDYLLIVDYYSRFIEFARLNDTKAKSVITHTKAVLRDIESQMLLEVIKYHNTLHATKYSKSWGFTHITTISYHSQSYGLAEKSLQILKCILSKAKQSILGLT